MNSRNRSQVRIIAHRGLSGEAPENTLPAFRKAEKGSFAGIETDIRLSRDGYLVCMHDESIDRTTDGSGKVSELKWEELKTLDAGSWFAPDFGGVRVPLFAEYLAICAESGKQAYVELKGDFNPEDLQAVLDHINEIHSREQTAIIAFEYSLLEEVRSIDPDIRLGLCTSRLKSQTVEKIQKLGRAFGDIKYSSLTQRQVEDAAEKGIAVECWTVNSPPEAHRLVSWGVSGLTTDIDLPRKF